MMSIRIASTSRIFLSISISILAVVATTITAATPTNNAEAEQHLQQFGYLRPQGRLDAALRRYQRFHGLPVTGYLDAGTMHRMRQPRCGREDLTVNSAVDLFSLFDGNRRWNSHLNLTYWLSLNGVATIGLDSVRIAFEFAFRAWSAVVPVTFTETEDRSEADITVEFMLGSHGDDQSFDGVLGVLGHAFSPEDGRIHLDAAEQWTLDAVAAGMLGWRSAVDLPSVALHEVGHVIGLAHSAVEESVMFPSIAALQVKLNLSMNDILSAQAIYGAPPSPPPPPVPPVHSLPPPISRLANFPSPSSAPVPGVAEHRIYGGQDHHDDDDDGGEQVDEEGYWDLVARHF